MEVVADTNVVLDIFFFKDASVEPIAEALLKGELQLVTSQATRFELEDVLAREPFLGQASRARSFAEERRRYFVDFEGPIPEKAYCRDSDDDKFFNLARASGADCFVTRDKLCLKAKGRAAKDGIVVIDPKGFALLLANRVRPRG